MSSDRTPLTDALEDVPDALTTSRLVPVIGSGISIAAAALPSWRALIQHGIDFAQASGGSDFQQTEKAHQLLEQGALVDAASQGKTMLGAPSGHYAAWLQRVFYRELADIKNRATLNAIADLLPPLIATTNYDHVLEATLLEPYHPITWRDPNELIAALHRGRAVFHLHGSLHKPDSVVLGIDNYDELVANPAYTDVLRCLWLERTLLFIGCSFDGLQDPDFSRMLHWFNRTFPRAPHRHYAMMLDGTYTPEQRREWLHDFRVQIIPYGPTHSDLAPAIRSIKKRTLQESTDSFIQQGQPFRTTFYCGSPER